MAEKYEVGTIVEGKVVRIKPFGAIVALEGGKQGLVHISQIANSFVQDINDHITIGDMVKVKILSADEATGKISLSIRDTLPVQPKPVQNNRPFKPREQKSDFEKRPPKQNYDGQQSQSTPVSDFEEKMKEWLKESNERQAGLNKRNNKR